MTNKNIKRFKLIVRMVMEINKSVSISLRKGRYKSFGEFKNRTMFYEFYKLRDEYRAVLYNCQKLLINLQISKNVELSHRLVKLLLESAFVRVLCVDKVLSNRGGFTPGLDKKRGISDHEFEIFINSKSSELTKINYDVKLV